MTINTFDVTPEMVRDDFLPHDVAGFSADSSPTWETVDRWITQEAARLYGQLLQNEIDATSIDDDETPQWQWCQQTLCLMVVVRLIPVKMGLDPEVVRAWRADLAARLQELNDNGEIALGMDNSGSAGNPKGPTTYITELGLEVPSAADASSITPRLRRDDEL